MAQDTHIRDDIERELFYTCQFNPALVGVSVEDGIVTLTGTLQSYEEKLAALRAAARTPQVRAVACNLEVRLPGPSVPTDADLARAAANILTSEGSIPPGRVRILAENGWITLQGTVESQHQRHAVAQVISTIAGVKGIDNLITVNAALDAERIKEQIEAALAASPSIEDRNILVEVNQDKVVLHGEVRSAAERDETERIAWCSAGVCDVANHIMLTKSVSAVR